MEEKASMNKHGGSRKVQSWEEKLLLLEDEEIHTFLAGATCDCKCNCFNAIRELKEYGIDMIRDLREARLAGKCVGAPNMCTLSWRRCHLNCHLFQQKFQLDFHPRGGENVF